MAIILDRKSKGGGSKKPEGGVKKVEEAESGGGRMIPLIPIKEGVIFPFTEPGLVFGRPRSVAAADAAYKSGGVVCLVTQKDAGKKSPDEKDVYRVGTVAKIEKLLPIEGTLHALVRGLYRGKIGRVESGDGYLRAEVEKAEEELVKDERTMGLAKHVVNSFKKAVALGKSVDLSVFMRLMAGVEYNELADQVASVLDISTEEKQQLLEMMSVSKRLDEITNYLARELRVLEVEQAIASKTQKRIDKTMRENILRERKRTIERELGEIGVNDAGDPEIMEMRRKVKKSLMPVEVKEKAEKYIKKLTQMSPNNPEAGYLRTYMEWLVDMPWGVFSPNNVSLREATKVLEEDHYGLKKVKERVIEYLAVMKLKQAQAKLEEGKVVGKKLGKKGAKKDGEAAKPVNTEPGGPTILCFVGPPGVGKTSIGRSIAKALGRKFVRMSLGGIRDEAEIRGHRRTYVGALPGRIIQGVKNAGTQNPVFMLDEIDKVGADFRGDPSAALLEALDPEQNHEFSDHYLEVPFDLSQVMFITTANVLDTIPPALRDRLEIIQFPGYTEEEKFTIARRFLWEKQLKFNGLEGEKDLVLAREALIEVIRHYTREAGVRNLERNLATVCRKLARRKAEKKELPQRVSVRQVHKYLGPVKYLSQLAEKQDEVGMATGLAYTQSGGDILFIEVTLVPGKGKLTLTGHLGQVMKESCQAAFSYVRSRWKELGVNKDFAQKTDVHIHVPEGAVPKDGPSAGIAIATAITSALTKRPTHREVAMTGEITLRGRVMEIGGVKEKVIAAHRAGIKTVIMPKNNKKDLDDVPAKVKKDIKFVFVEHLDEVLKVALYKSKLKFKTRK